MDRLSLVADERVIFGKALKRSRRDGLIPANVYGKNEASEAVFVKPGLFKAIYEKVGETGVIDLKIGSDKSRPVMVKDLQVDAVRGELLHVDFYQVDLNKPVRVYVPIEVIGEEPESVHMGDTVVLNPVQEIEVEALPGDLVEKVEVDVSALKEIDDAVTVADLKIDREKITVITPEEEVIIKLAPAVTEEMAQLLKEQEEEAAAAVVEETAEGETAKEGDQSEEDSVEGEADKASPEGDQAKGDDLEQSKE